MCRWMEGRFDGLHWVYVGEEGRRHLGLWIVSRDDALNSKADAASELARLSSRKSNVAELS